MRISWQMEVERNAACGAFPCEVPYPKAERWPHAGLSESSRARAEVAALAAGGTSNHALHVLFIPPEPIFYTAHTVWVQNVAHRLWAAVNAWQLWRASGERRCVRWLIWLCEWIRQEFVRVEDG